MFRLSESAMHTLKIISNRFQQAAIEYEPLFHQRFLPWDGSYASQIEDEQWDAFVEANRNSFDDDEWWECVPAYCGIGLSGNFLNRWFGHPDGLEHFERLVDSVLLVLGEEDLSGVDDSEIPFRFRSFDDWVSTLHNWAIRFRMPFLRSSMRIWNSATQNTHAFDELTKKWTEEDGVSFPSHPLCWTLYDDVFTCSAMAIETLCNPSMITTTNEAWPSGVEEPECPLIAVDHDAHRLIETPVGFVAIVAGSSKVLGSRQYRDGMARLACLLLHQTERVEALTIKNVTYKTKLSEMMGAPQRRLRVASHKDESDDPESFERIRNRISELRGMIDNAKENGEYAAQEEAQTELDKIFDTYEFGDDGKLYRKSLERDQKVKDAGDSVRATIFKAIDDVRRSASEFSEILNALKTSIRRKDGFVSIHPNPDATPWVVRSICESSD